MNKQEILDLIDVHDETLKIMRDEWMGKGGKPDCGYLKGINAGLDHRLKLMKMRDKLSAGVDKDA